MEDVDDGVLYMDAMGWLLSPRAAGEEALDGRMLAGVGQLLVHLRLALLDHLLMAILHSARLWTPQTANKLAAPTNIEPFPTIFLKLEAACSARFHRSRLPLASSPPNTPSQNLPAPKPSAFTFIGRWTAVVLRSAANRTDTDVTLRSLCMATVLLASLKPFDLPARLRRRIEQACLTLISQSVLHTQSAPASPQATTHFHPDSVLSWLAVQVIPSLSPPSLAESSPTGIITHLAQSLFHVFDDGHVFDGLSTSLDAAAQLQPHSQTAEDLLRLSAGPLAKVVLSISMSISRLVENTRLSDVDAVAAALTRLARMTARINASWGAATSAHAHLPPFKQPSTSLTHHPTLQKDEDSPLDRWLRTTFFVCLLILGGLANTLAIHGLPSPAAADPVLESALQILAHIHFIAARFPADTLSTHATVLDTLTALAASRPGLPVRVLQQAQPSLVDDQNVSDAVGTSLVVYYMNLVERFTGAVIPQAYLDDVVVPLVWTCIPRAPLGSHALLAWAATVRSYSKDTVLSLADEYFEVLVQDVARNDHSVLSFDQQKHGWTNLIKAVSGHSRTKTKELSDRLTDAIRSLDGSKSMPTSAAETNAGPGPDTQTRSKLFKLLVAQIGALACDASDEDTAALLDACWALVRTREEAVELFEDGVARLDIVGVRWWTRQTARLGHLSKL